MLASRAARILQADGEILEAIELYQRAQDWQSAAALLAREARTLLGQDGGQALRTRIGALPAAHIASHPWLSYWHGASLVQVDPPAARQLLEQAFEQLKAAGDEIGQLVRVVPA